MRYTRYLLLVGLLALVNGLAGCAQPPDDAIAKAEEALKHAVEAGADEASPRIMGKARTSLSEAKSLTDQGHYAEARKKAENAELQFNQARKNAEKTGGKRITRPGAGGGGE
ncbi:MAG: DUF4398 domain-containing protein [Calditrichaeota bacterium]|nr:DUF4398 domain-containing protein [Calditrichota bacterium]